MKTETIDENPYDITAHDSDPSNVMLRAGYMVGMANKATGDDQLFLLRASRSLRAFAAMLRKEVKGE